MLMASLALVLAFQIKAADEAGRQLFASHCAGCHGIDGGGGEHAPNIATSARVQSLSDSDLERIVHDGITAGGMPAFGSSFTPAEIHSVVAYLRVLHGNRSKATPSGDPASGAKLFYGSSHCSQCHMVAGRGGYFGVDLTNYASSHAVDAIREAILYPGKVLDPLQESAQIELKDGSHFVGMIRNQDNFSMQLQTADGEFHLLEKSDIAVIKEEPLPGHQSAALSAAQVNDIVSFLLAGK